ncbi:hypothetical protein [Devosia sp. UYZn731]|uniref:hypothetical protein n=1 Tax=Devosia sp. UYZn731 TaxID=3156345 RepID=UPI0033932533
MAANDRNGVGCCHRKGEAGNGMIGWVGDGPLQVRESRYKLFHCAVLIPGVARAVTLKSFSVTQNVGLPRYSSKSRSFFAGCGLPAGTILGGGSDLTGLLVHIAGGVVGAFVVGQPRVPDAEQAHAKKGLKFVTVYKMSLPRSVVTAVLLMCLWPFTAAAQATASLINSGQLCNGGSLNFCLTENCPFRWNSRLGFHREGSLHIMSRGKPT